MAIPLSMVDTTVNLYMKRYLWLYLFVTDAYTKVDERHRATTKFLYETEADEDDKNYRALRQQTKNNKLVHWGRTTNIVGHRKIQLIETESDVK